MARRFGIHPATARVQLQKLQIPAATEKTSDGRRLRANYIAVAGDGTVSPGQDSFTVTARG